MQIWKKVVEIQNELYKNKNKVLQSQTPGGPPPVCKKLKEINNTLAKIQCPFFIRWT